MAWGNGLTTTEKIVKFVSLIFLYFLNPFTILGFLVCFVKAMNPEVYGINMTGDDFFQFFLFILVEWFAYGILAMSVEISHNLRKIASNYKMKDEDDDEEDE